MALKGGGGGCPCGGGEDLEGMIELTASKVRVLFWN